MKNKTLEKLKNGATIYGANQLDRILNFKAVKSITRGEPYTMMITINLVDGDKIETYYIA